MPVEFGVNLIRILTVTDMGVLEGCDLNPIVKTPLMETIERGLSLSKCCYGIGSIIPQLKGI